MSLLISRLSLQLNIRGKVACVTIPPLESASNDSCCSFEHPFSHIYTYTHAKLRKDFEKLTVQYESITSHVILHSLTNHRAWIYIRCVSHERYIGENWLAWIFPRTIIASFVPSRLCVYRFPHFERILWSIHERHPFDPCRNGALRNPGKISWKVKMKSRWKKYVG